MHAERDADRLAASARGRPPRHHADRPHPDPHTNDIHGQLDAEEIKTGSSTFLQGGMALMAGAVTDLRSRAPERTLLLDGGDARSAPGENCQR